jgi:hypothetical protein
VRLVFDPGRAVATGEEGAAAPVPLVEPLRVRAAEEVHAGGHVLAARVDDEMKVILHRAARMDTPAEAGGRAGEEPSEIVVVEIGSKEILVTRGVGGDVVEAVREVASRHSRHASTVAPTECEMRLRA